MVELLRVDHRLLHGQVVFSWCSALNPDCILVANDEAVADELRKTTLRMSKPAGVKLVIKSVEDSIAAINAGKTDKYHMLVVVSNVADAVRMAESCDSVGAINLGGTKAVEGTHPVSRMVNLTDVEEGLLVGAQSKGIDVFIQAVPKDKRVEFDTNGTKERG